jgi:hypothetical protein
MKLDLLLVAVLTLIGLCTTVSAEGNKTFEWKGVLRGHKIRVHLANAGRPGHQYLKTFRFWLDDRELPVPSSKLGVVRLGKLPNLALEPGSIVRTEAPRVYRSTDGTSLILVGAGQGPELYRVWWRVSTEGIDNPIVGSYYYNVNGVYAFPNEPRLRLGFDVDTRQGAIPSQ